MQVRESVPAKKIKFNRIGIYGENMPDNLDSVVKNALALEHGRYPYYFIITIIIFTVQVLQIMSGGAFERMNAVLNLEILIF